MNTKQGREARFRGIYAAAYDDVFRFVQRRTPPDRSEDVVADAFLAAWRRIDDLPADLSDARAWLFGIARHCLLNDYRSHRRAEGLGVRLADAAAVSRPGDDADAVTARVDLARAWALLSDAEQEVIALSALDLLTSAQAGAVLDISATAFRLRLSRARAALRRHLEGAATPVAASISKEN